jgi:hypothetical protein
VTEPNPAGDGRTVTVRVPISIRRRGGRKLVLAPDGTNVITAPVRRHIDNAMVKAIARAFRWREMLENGTYATIAEIAAAEKINESYVSRLLRLTLLAPDIVEAILGGRQPAETTLAVLMRPFSVDWGEQQAEICPSCPAAIYVSRVDAGRGLRDWKDLSDMFRQQFAEVLRVARQRAPLVPKNRARLLKRFALVG